MTSERVSIIILNYNTYEMTNKCVALLKTLNYPNLDIIVVDNASTNDSYEILHENFKNTDTLLIKSPKNGGYAYGNNIGLRKAYELESKYVLIINNDIELTNNEYINECISIMKSNDKLALIGPAVIENNKRVYPTFKKREHPFEIISSFAFIPLISLKRKRYIKKNQFNTTNFFTYSVKGCCMFFDLEVLKNIQYFDEHTFLFVEEGIIGEKLLKENHKVMYCPSLEVIHNHSHTLNSELTQNEMKSYFIDSYTYYLREYRNDINKSLQAIIIFGYKWQVNGYWTLIRFIKKVLRKK